MFLFSFLFSFLFWFETTNSSTPSPHILNNHQFTSLRVWLRFASTIQYVLCVLPTHPNCPNAPISQLITYNWITNGYPKLKKKNLHDYPISGCIGIKIEAVTGNHIKQLNSASSDSELHRFRTKPLSTSLSNMAALNNDMLYKQRSLDRDSMTSSKGLLFSPIGLKHNVTEKVAQVGGLVRISAFLHSAWLIYLVDLKLLLAAEILMHLLLIRVLVVLWTWTWYILYDDIFILLDSFLKWNFRPNMSISIWLHSVLHWVT